MNDFDIIYRKTLEIINEINDVIRIEDYELFDKKASFVLATDSFMGSVEVLSDFTYDFFILHIGTEKPFGFKTKKFYIIEDLINEIKSDIKDLSILESVGIEGSDIA